jgi:hypothetical protein
MNRREWRKKIWTGERVCRGRVMRRRGIIFIVTEVSW